MTSKFKTKLLCKSACISALMFMGAASANAQEAPAEGEDVNTDMIIVTGSRIARPELESATPVQVLSNTDLLNQGTVNVADTLNELPALGTPGYNRANTNFATSGNGVSTLNLRNLDDNRTLVLLNGRRIVAGIPSNSAVDINVIPTDLLKSTEIITGGASAVYGSEAIAGVVNFVLRDDFEGLRLRAQSGITDKGDNQRSMLSGTFGVNFAEDRGNFAISGQYDKDQGLRSRNRAISAVDRPFRSSYTPQGRFFIDDNPATEDVDESTSYTYGQDGNLKEGYVSAVDGFNRNGERYIAVPLERYLGTAIGHFDVTDSITVFGEGSYSKTKSRSRLEPYAFDNSDAELDGEILPGLSIDNPFIPTTIRNAMLAAGQDVLGFTKRSNGVFDRSNKSDREFYRIVADLRGSVDDNWKWEAYYNYGQTKEKTRSGTALRDRLYHALNAVAGPNGPICADADARAAGCAPLNVFGFNSASAAAINYVTANGIEATYDAKVQQEVMAANLTGTVFTLPAGDVKISTGLERRIEKSREDYDAATQAGNTLSNALSNTVGRYKVWEAYGEALVPILADRPFFDYLGVEAAVRYADYSSVGSVWSWKVGGDWAPIPDVRFRAVYSVATRAPNIEELYAGANQDFPNGLTDPCEGVTAATAGDVANYCRSLPGIAAQIAQAGVFNYDDNLDRQSIEGLDRSNPNLGPEKAKTLTLGTVFTPQFLRNFSLTVDFFDIKINKAITQVPRQFIINQCTSSLGASDLCDLIVREGVTTPRPRTPGTIFQVDTLPINAASIKTRGIDVGLNYSSALQPIGLPGSIDLKVAYTYLDKLQQTPVPGDSVQNNRGQLDGDGRLGAGFKHRANISTSYSIDGVTFFVKANYLSAIKDTLGPDEDSPLGDETNSVSSRWYFDAQMRFNVGQDDQFQFYVGVDNVFDRKPPFINQNGASNITGTETAADSYDPFGRAFYAGITANF